MITSRQSYKLVTGDLSLVDISGIVLAQDPPVTYNAGGVFNAPVSGKNVHVRGEDLCWLGECIAARYNINSGTPLVSSAANGSTSGGAAAAYEYEFRRGAWASPASGVRASLPTVYDNLRELYWHYNNAFTRGYWLKDNNGSAPSCMSGLYAQYTAQDGFSPFWYSNQNMFLGSECYCSGVDQLAINSEGAARLTFMQSYMPKLKWGSISGDYDYSGMSYASYGTQFLFLYTSGSSARNASGNVVVTLHHSDHVESVRPFYFIMISTGTTYTDDTPGDIYGRYAIIANSTYTPTNGVVTLNPVADVVAAAMNAPGADFSTSTGGNIQSRSQYINLLKIELMATLDDDICALTASVS